MPCTLLVPYSTVQYSCLTLPSVASLLGTCEQTSEKAGSAKILRKVITIPRQKYLYGHVHHFNLVKFVHRPVQLLLAPYCSRVTTRGAQGPPVQLVLSTIGVKPDKLSRCYPNSVLSGERHTVSNVDCQRAVVSRSAGGGGAPPPALNIDASSCPFRWLVFQLSKLE